MVPALGAAFGGLGGPGPRPPPVAVDARTGSPPDSVVPEPRVAVATPVARPSAPVLRPRESAGRRDEPPHVQPADADRAGAANGDRRRARQVTETDTTESCAVEEPETVQVLKTGAWVVEVEAIGGGKRHGGSRDTRPPRECTAGAQRVGTANAARVVTGGVAAPPMLLASQSKRADAVAGLAFPPRGTRKYCTGTGARRRPYGTRGGNNQTPRSNRSRMSSDRETREDTTPPYSR